MAFAAIWYWNSGTDDSPIWTAFGSGNIIKMVGGVFSTSIPVDNYQSGMHLQTSSLTDTDACASPHLSNLKYTESNKAAIRGTYTSALGASFPAATMCLKIVVTDSDTPTSFTTENGGLFFYDGTTPATAPTDLTTQGLEQSDSSWTSCGGSANEVSIGDKTVSATSQTFYVAVSAMPTGIGSLTASLRFTVDYDTGGGAVSLTSDVDVEIESVYCDSVNSDHILNIISTTENRPIIKKLVSRTIDNVYGTGSDSVYGTTRQIVGLVVSESGYYSESMQRYGITTQSTPALLVPIWCEYTIGSRVYDLITKMWYELVKESDVIQHYESSLSEVSNYREYNLVKVQGEDI